MQTQLQQQTEGATGAQQSSGTLTDGGDNPDFGKVNADENQGAADTDADKAPAKSEDAASGE